MGPGRLCSSYRMRRSLAWGQIICFQLPRNFRNSMPSIFADACNGSSTRAPPKRYRRWLLVSPLAVLPLPFHWYHQPPTALISPSSSASEAAESPARRYSSSLPCTILTGKFARSTHCQLTGWMNFNAICCVLFLFMVNRVPIAALHLPRPTTHRPSHPNSPVKGYRE